MAKDLGLGLTDKPPAGAVTGSTPAPVPAAPRGALPQIKAKGGGHLYHCAIQCPLPPGCHQAEVEAASEKEAQDAFFAYYGITQTVNPVTIQQVA
jgi:hypothetical protein